MVKIIKKLLQIEIINESICGAVHKRRQQFGGGGEESNFTESCRRTEVKNCRHGGVE